MKVTGYQPQVNLDPIGNVRVEASRDSNAYGANQSGADALLGGIDKLQKVYQQAQDEKMTADVMAANVEYSKRMNDLLYGNEGLMLKQQNGAENIAGEMEVGEKRIRQEVQQQFKFKHSKATLAFNNMANRDAMQRYELVRRHQFQESEKYKDTTYVNYVNEQTNFAIGNYADNESIMHTAVSIDAATAARFASQGIEVVKQKQLAAKTGLFSNLLFAAQKAGDYKAVNNLIDKYGAYMPVELKSKAQAFVVEVKAGNDKATALNAIYSEFGDNIEAGLSNLRNSGIYQSVEVAGVGVDIPVMDNIDMSGVKPTLKAAIPSIGTLLGDLAQGAQISSGYRDSARNAAANGAKNSYHLKGDALDFVLPRNLSEAEMEQMKNKFAPYFNEVLFHDAGSGNHLHLAGYKENLKAGVSSRPRTAKEKQDLETEYANFVANKTKVISMQHQANQRAGEKALMKAIESGVTDPLALKNIAKEYSKGELGTLQALYKDAENLSAMSSKKTALADQTKIQLRSMIETGEINDRSKLSNWLMENGSYSDYKEFVNLFDSIEKKEDKYGYDWAGIQQQAFESWGTKDKGIFFYARQATDEFINDYKNKNNGALPSQFAVQQKLIEYGTKPTGSVYNTLWENSGLNVANMRMLGLYDIKQNIINGKAMYKLYRNDGSNADATQEQLDSLIEKAKDRKEIK